MRLAIIIRESLQQPYEVETWKTVCKTGYHYPPSLETLCLFPSRDVAHSHPLNLGLVCETCLGQLNIAR